MEPPITPLGADATSELMDMNLFGWPWTGLVTLFTLLVYLILALNSALARNKYGVKLPRLDGPDDYLRIMRAHVNTLEQIVLFLPLLWLTAFATNDEMAAMVGVAWPLSRILYALGYYRSVEGRLPGFILGFLVIVALFILSAIHIVRSLLSW